MSSKTQEEINVMVSDLNAEITFSLSTLSIIKHSSEDLKKAHQLSKIRSSDIDTISSIAHILIHQNPDLTDRQIASKLLKELANSHPNRVIKKVSKKMVKQKWGEKHETE